MFSSRTSKFSAQAPSPEPRKVRPPRRATIVWLGVIALSSVVAAAFQASAVTSTAGSHRDHAASAHTPAARHAVRLVGQGRRTFRVDTFGDQKFWGGTLHLDRAIAGRKNGGVGPGVSPKTALAVGLKVDVKKLPRSVRSALAAGK